MVDRSDERPMFIAPDDIQVSIGNGQVWLRLGKPHPSLGFSEEIVLAVELSPHEAAAIGELLVRKAREAQASQSH